MKRPVVAGVLALILMLPILFMGALIAIAGEDVAPSDKALKEIPADLLPTYQTAATTCDGLAWTILAAIHRIETNFGRGLTTSSKGAQGPMQFMPSTWRSYGIDGDGDGLADINDVDDAVFSAAFLLCENGAGNRAQIAVAIWNFNHSDQYVAEVLELAASYGVVTFEGSIVAASPGEILAAPRISLAANARADIEAGLVDARILALLETLSRRYTLGVSVLKTGHSKYVTNSERISNHFYGRAVDISSVAGYPVGTSNVQARQVVAFLAGLRGQIRPEEVGHPFSEFRFSGGFSDEDHRGHIHIGYD